MGISFFPFLFFSISTLRDVGNREKFYYIHAVKKKKPSSFFACIARKGINQWLDYSSKTSPLEVFFL